VTTEAEPIHGSAEPAVTGGPISSAELLEHAPILLAAARAIVMNDREAEDLVQTTLEIALRRGHQLRDRSSLRAWLLVIETREAFRLVRRLRRLVSLDVAMVELPAAGVDLTDSIAVRRALGSLPQRMRAAVVLHHMVGLSVVETGTALGVSENTVKSQLKVGLARLRTELGDD